MASPRRKKAQNGSNTAEDSPTRRFKPFQCGTCGESFTTKEYIENHMRTHTVAVTPLRQSPRKKAVQQPAAQNPLSLSLLTDAASYLERARGDKSTCEPHSGKAKANPQVPDQPQPAASGSSSEDERPAKHTAGKPPKMTKRALQSQGVITLEVLKHLPGKTLVDLFSEYVASSNTYGDKFTIKCRLFPDSDVCQAVFHGYKNEDKVRKDMEKHLVEHRNALIKQGSTASQFQTSSIQFRKKQAEITYKKKKTSATTSSTAKRSSSKFTSLRSNPQEPELVQDDQNSSHSEADSVDSKKKINKAKKVKRATPSQMTAKQDDKENKPTASTSSDAAGVNSTQRKRKRPKNPTKDETSSNDSSSDAAPSEGDRVEIIEGEPKLYPAHDHDYSAPPGSGAKNPPKKKRKIVRQQSNDTDAADSDDAASISSGVSLESTVSQDLSRGIHLYEEQPPSTPMVCNEETFQESVEEKKLFTGQGQMIAPEEDNSFSEDAEIEAGMKKQRRPALPRTKNDQIPEWEKKLAMKCIRELKQRKKDEKIEYVCKICKEGKKFTAGATLIYHYRSHAGIKPFQCNDCGQKFTRQHSKNYHMMIHRNESRFICKECGKRFRHPSHYTEHKRKHTGETPFECSDCQMKFKTRNTYKRHLKTRHGKLLTARGIKRMSREEFAKVRTKPYKKSNESSPSHEHGGSQESVPGPSSIPAASQAVDQKVPRRLKASTATQSTSIPMAPTTVAVVTPTVSLPPVSTILPHFSHPQGSAASLNNMVSHATVHINPSPPVGAVSQPSVGVIPPMGAMQHTSPGVGMLGMTMVGTGMVSPSAGLPTPTQMTMVRQAVNVGMGQPTSISLPSLPGQAYYTITAFTPIVPMETAATAYPAQPQQREVGSISDEDDASHYKPVGFVTHGQS